MPERPAVAATRPQRAGTGSAARAPGLALLVIATAQLMVVVDRSIRFNVRAPCRTEVATAGRSFRGGGRAQECPGLSGVVQ